MTPAEQHNLNVAAAKAAIEVALNLAQEARNFAATLDNQTGVPYAAFLAVDAALPVLEKALGQIEEAMVPTYDVTREEQLAALVHMAKPGSGKRYEFAKQLVAHMANRPKP